MKTLQFKTNINCNNCVRAVTGFLNDVPSVKEWAVDIDNPDKILTVKGDEVTIEEIVEAVEDAGFDVKEVVAG
ncbi:MAG: heavy-metal-associated domain-containing protein [Phaeodactylibacter sp.]|nr:heavy-metal-associated domain-containing protein [Phaeodactylibacter sp.]MCB9286170.1 heavy-metal-associated domain-containing protein [Lewinellaceae bacterium]